MNIKHSAIAVAATASAGVIALLTAKKNSDYAEYYAETFPQLDPELLKKAHAALMRAAFTQKLDMTGWNKERYEEALVAEYKLLSQ
jgi:hypothetical protein